MPPKACRELRAPRGKLGLKGKKKILAKDKPESEPARITTRVLKSAGWNSQWTLDEIWGSLAEDMVTWANHLSSVKNEKDAMKVLERLEEIDQMSLKARRFLMISMFSKRGGVCWCWERTES
jgi:hypothetical protein